MISLKSKRHVAQYRRPNYNVNTSLRPAGFAVTVFEQIETEYNSFDFYSFVDVSVATTASVLIKLKTTSKRIYSSWLNKLDGHRSNYSNVSAAFRRICRRRRRLNSLWCFGSKYPRGVKIWIFRGRRCWSKRGYYGFPTPEPTIPARLSHWNKKKLKIAENRMATYQDCCGCLRNDYYYRPTVVGARNRNERTYVGWETARTVEFYGNINTFTDDTSCLSVVKG